MDCAKTILGEPSILSPPPKTIFFLEQEISQEREFVASQIGDYKKMFLIVQTYLGGRSYYSPPFSFNPPNPVSSSRLLLLFFLKIPQHQVGDPTSLGSIVPKRLPGGMIQSVHTRYLK